MGLLDYFRPVSTWSAQRVRSRLEEDDPEACNLVDVREPEEYLAGHIPGAFLIPLAALHERLAQLDPERTTVVYCATGMRSRAAATVLGRAGFRDVYSMSGGLQAWSGWLTRPMPGSDQSALSGNEFPDELVAIAWTQEERARRFYGLAAELIRDSSLAGVLTRIAAEEEGHMALLRSLYETLALQDDAPEFAAAVLSAASGFPFLEGGILERTVMESLGQADDVQLMQLAIYMETNSYDQHLGIGRDTWDDRVKETLLKLAEAERQHLRLLQAAAFPLLSSAAAGPMAGKRHTR